MRYRQTTDRQTDRCNTAVLSATVSPIG